MAHDIWFVHPKLGPEPYICDLARLADLGPEATVLSVCEAALAGSEFHAHQLGRMAMGIYASTLADGELDGYVCSELPRSRPQAREFALHPPATPMRLIRQIVSPYRAGTITNPRRRPPGSPPLGPPER